MSEVIGFLTCERRWSRERRISDCCAAPRSDRAHCARRPAHAGNGVVYIAATNAVAGKSTSITLDAAGVTSTIIIGGADLVSVTSPLSVSTLLRPAADLSADLGTAIYRWGTLYVNQIVATTISGTTMSGWRTKRVRIIGPRSQQP